jgi:DNA-binding HxlR family transcriptional regulator
MSRKRFEKMNCAAAQALEQIGDWWTLLIVREALYGTKTFSGFQAHLGIAKNILTGRLEALVEHGVLTRRQTKPGAGRYEYLPAEKGEALLPVLVALMQWGDMWVFGGKGPVEIIDSKDRRPVKQMAVEAFDGRGLGIRDLRFRPGSAASEETLARFRAKANPITDS